MSNFIDSASAGAALGGTIGSVVPGIGNVAGTVGGAVIGGVSSLISPNHEKATSPSAELDGTYINLGKVGNKKQSRAMDSEARLAALQQYYAQQNNQQDMQNTYNLTRDTAQLEAEGKRNAGLSLAGDGTSVGASSAPSIESPSLPSAPSADDSPSEMDTANYIRDVSSLLSTIGVNKSQERVNNANAQGAEIDNQTKEAKNLAELEQLYQSNKISRVEYKRRKGMLQVENATTEDKIEQEHQATLRSQYEAKIAAIKVDEEEINKDILSISKQMNEQQLKQLQFIVEHQQERYDAEMREIASRIDLNSKQGEAAVASAAASLSTKTYNDVLSACEKAKLPYADKIARAIAQSAVNQCNTSYWEAKHEKLNYASDKDTKSSWSYNIGQHGRNLLGGWLPFSSNYNFNGNKHKP